jgi:hypothetical protein
MVNEVDPLYPSADWNSIAAKVKKNGYKRFRIYTSDCMCGTASGSGVRIKTFYIGDAYPLAIGAAKNHGVTVLVGTSAGKFTSIRSQSLIH